MGEYIDDDEPLTLSSGALDALMEFYSERDAQTETFEQLKAKADRPERLSMKAFKEDWQESQFWYTEKYATFLAQKLLDGATDETTIAMISVPSVFVAMKNILNAEGYDGPQPVLHLLEHDRRFEVFPEFTFYDLNQPLKLSADLKGTVDRFIIDPPFLNADTQTKVALTVKYLLSAPATPDRIRALACTGERMKDVVTRLYRFLDLRPTTFEPEHHQLQNEFLCYANFASPDWQFRDT